MQDSTFVLTLVNDNIFYELRHGTQAVTRGLHLYNAHHSKEMLTVQQRLTAIIEALNEFEEDHKDD